MHVNKCLRVSSGYAGHYLLVFSDAEVMVGCCGPLEKGDFQGWKTSFIYVFILVEGQGEIEVLESKMRGRHHVDALQAGQARDKFGA